MRYSKHTYTYKTAQNCSLQADVYRSESSKPMPGLLWLHGGGLIFGNREQLPPEQIQLYVAAGFTVISIDYRLAPETKLSAIVEDVQDAYQWVHSEGPALFGIDPDRLAFIGHSSGGYLGLMAALRVRPRPKALVSFYGYGDISGDWPRQPNPHYTQQPLVAREEAYSGVGGSAIAGSEFTGFSDKRWLFYLFCRQQGLWIREIVGKDDPLLYDAFSPARHITPDYPPTLLLHGDQDTDVPVESSQQMALSLKQHQVPHELMVFEGLGHVFDRWPDPSLEGAPAGLKHPKVVEAFDTVVAFLRKHLK